MDNEWKIRIVRVVQLSITILLIQYISFLFEMDGASTAIMSAIVVSQSFIGGLYLKARNRIFGTAAGVAFGLVLAVLFPEAPCTFLTGALLWFVLTTMLASLVHSDRMYLYQLAGYTFAFVGFAILEAPDEAWHTLLYRATNVTMGLAIMLVSSSVIYPNYGALNLDYRVGRIYKRARTLMRHFEQAVSVDDSKIKGLFDALSLLISNRNYIKDEAALNAVQAHRLDSFLAKTLLMTFYANAARFVTPDMARFAHDYRTLFNELLLFRRHGLSAPAPTTQRTWRFREHAFFYPALRRGIRTLAGCSLMLLFWYYSGWQGGATMLTLGVVYLILCSAIPTPLPVSIEALNGTTQGIVLGYLYDSLIFSSTAAGHWSWLYFAAQLPLLIYGGLMLSKPVRIMRGITLLTTFYFVVPPENSPQFLYARFMDNSLGALAGVLIAGLTLCLVLPEKHGNHFRGLTIAMLKDIHATIGKGNPNMLRKMMLFHDRASKARSSSLYSDGREFRVLMNLASLYLLCFHVSRHQQQSAGLAPLSALLSGMIKRGDFSISANEHIHYLHAMAGIKNSSPESYPVALSAWRILLSVQRDIR
jgi:uncharacterized membrane protein YccC